MQSTFNTPTLDGRCLHCDRTFDRFDRDFGVTCQTPGCEKWVCPYCAEKRRDTIICPLGFSAERCFLRADDTPAILIGSHL
jgi:hypothetical protein